MDQPISKFSHFFKKYIEQNCTPGEREEFLEMVKREENALELNQLISKVIATANTDREITSERAEVLFRNILDAAAENEAIPMFPAKKKDRMWWAAAAILILMIGSGIYFILNEDAIQSITKKEETDKRFKNDVAPGRSGAILTLANGQQIVLDSAENGTLAMQGSANIVKQNGEIAYAEEGNVSGGEVLYNTMTTPKGRQYCLSLADGTKVWLNAASSITFPSAFTGKERRVELTGEAYFEVAHNAQMPFHVKVNDMEVEVLGTHFNVNAYDDEIAMETTLLEGSVKVSKGKESTLIVPGEQAVVSYLSDAINIKKGVDLDQVMSWKNGLFYFNKADLPMVMRQLSRWYDVNIVYEGTVPKREFMGEMQRDLHLSQVLELLGKNQVNFKIDGRKIIVMP